MLKAKAFYRKDHVELQIKRLRQLYLLFQLMTVKTSQASREVAIV